MAQKLIRDIRNDLAALGKEFTVKEMEEVATRVVGTYHGRLL